MRDSEFAENDEHLIDIFDVKVRAFYRILYEFMSVDGLALGK